jgi:Domain of unknown function (DUF1905)/Bacteriocin-protection, YdeI or OmpD-Associated
MASSLRRTLVLYNIIDQKIRHPAEWRGTLFSFIFNITFIKPGSMDNPLVNKKYKLEKFHGKGGWTFVQIPEILQNKSNPFGWAKVKGTIDDYEVRKCHLMPMGNGKLFLPVKAEIRRKIKKQEGDTVHVILYPDNEPLEIPEEFTICLKDEPTADQFFQTLSESEQKFYTEWIYSAKKEDTKISRMAKAIDRLAKNLKLYDKEND